MDNYYDIEEPKKEKGLSVRRVLRWLAYLIMASVIITLMVRCSIYIDDKIVSEVLQDDVFNAAYERSPEDFSVRQYGMKSAWVAIRDGRLIEFNYLYHIEKARELQFSVKYNSDLAEYLNEDGIPFKFRLIDNENNVYDDYFFKQKDKFGYIYLRLCFHNIDLSYETDGKAQRRTYTLFIDVLGEDGGYSELCSYLIYDGSEIYKDIDFKK